MKPDLLRRLVIGLGVLLTVWAGLSLLRRGRADRPETRRLDPLNAEGVDTIRLGRGDSAITLVRSGSAWAANGLPASGVLVKDLLMALGDTSSQGEVLARSASSHARLGVDSAAGKPLVVMAGDRTLLTWTIGKRGPDWESVYLTMPGSALVYLLRGRLGGIVDRRVDDWRDRRIAEIEPDSVMVVEVTRGKTGYRLARDGTTWRFGDGAPADSTEVARFLRQFRNLDASGFATPAQSDSIDFAQAARRVRLTGTSGASLLSLDADSAASNFWAKSDKTPIVFRVESWTVDQITPPDSTLRKRAAP
jgi:hypothetical protein